MQWLVAKGSVVLTQTHPAAPYVCRTGNITLRCQYDVTETVLSVQWIISGMLTDPATILGHTTTLPTSSYQEVVVDSYRNLMDSYTCSVIVLNGSLPSSQYIPTTEGECLYSPTEQYDVALCGMMDILTFSVVEGKCRYCSLHISLTTISWACHIHCHDNDSILLQLLK